MLQDVFDYEESKFDVYFTVQLVCNFAFVLKCVHCPQMSTSGK